MRPHLARRVSVVLWLVAAMCALVAVTLTIYLAVDWAMAAPVKPKTSVLVASLNPRPVEKPATLDSYRAIWKARILEEAPIAPTAAKPEPKAPVAPPPAAPQLSWVGVMAHTDRSKSRVILLDKRTNRQVLLGEGTPIADTLWRVTEIGRDAVRIQAGEHTCTIERPKPGRTSGKDTDQNKLIVPGNGRTPPPPAATDTQEEGDEG